MTTSEVPAPVAFAQRVFLLVAVVAGIGLLLSTLVLPGALATERALGAVRSDVLEVPPLPAEIRGPAENSVVLASDGTKLAELHNVENRILVPLGDVPQVTQNALLATEDADFYSHRGVNHRAILRALLANVRAGGIEEGASTITQQYLRQATQEITTEVSLERKINEAMWAIALEKRLSKEDILERYLNAVYFGDGVYGIGTAARHYFSKHVSQLTLEESALLVGVIRAPERNNPTVAPDLATTRRNIVLGQMARQGFITSEDAERAKAAPLGLKLSPKLETVEPFFVDWVKRILYDPSTELQPDVQAALGESKEQRLRAVFEGGLVIHTTLDPKFQRTADETIRQYLTDPLQDPLAALVTVEAASGAVRAMAVGPKAYGNCPEDLDPCEVTKVNPAVPGAGGSGRQSGSAFKGLVLTAALANGLSPGTTFETSSGQSIEGCEKLPGEPYRVNNYAGGGGGFMDLYEGAKRSNNVYFAKLTQAVGVENVKLMAERLGITDSPNWGDFGEKSCSIGLGSADVFPLQMAEAYATLANRGVHCEPFAIDRIEDRSGRLIYQHSEDCERVVDQGVVDRAVDILLGPPSPGGTASYIRGQLGRPVAGKTGTTQDWRNAWFMGFVPQYATAAWVGYELQFCPWENDPDFDREGFAHGCGSMRGVEANGIPYRTVTGGTIPGRMWADYMERVLEDVPVAEFAAPPPIPTVAVPNVVGMSEEEATGLLEARDFRVTTDTVTHHFPAGTVAEQSPAAGSSVWKGSGITLFVSDGQGEPPTVAVPDVIGKSEADAIATLEGAGFLVRVVDTEAQNESHVGLVVQQSPEGGAQVEEGSRVVIAVAREKEGQGDGGGNGNGGNGGGGGGGDGGGGDGDTTNGGAPEPSPSPTPSDSPSD